MDIQHPHVIEWMQKYPKESGYVPEYDNHDFMKRSFRKSNAIVLKMIRDARGELIQDRHELIDAAFYGLLDRLKTAHAVGWNMPWTVLERHAQKHPHVLEWIRENKGE